MRISRLQAITEALDHEPCCGCQGSEYGNCSECYNTGHYHAPYVDGEAEKDMRHLLWFAKEVLSTYKQSLSYAELDSRMNSLLIKLEDR